MQVWVRCGQTRLPRHALAMQIQVKIPSHYAIRYDEINKSNKVNRISCDLWPFNSIPNQVSFVEMHCVFEE